MQQVIETNGPKQLAKHPAKHQLHSTTLVAFKISNVRKFLPKSQHTIHHREISMH